MMDWYQEFINAENMKPWPQPGKGETLGTRLLACEGFPFKIPPIDVPNHHLNYPLKMLSPR